MCPSYGERDGARARGSDARASSAVARPGGRVGATRERTGEPEARLRVEPRLGSQARAESRATTDDELRRVRLTSETGPAPARPSSAGPRLSRRGSGVPRHPPRPIVVASTSVTHRDDLDVPRGLRVAAAWAWRILLLVLAGAAVLWVVAKLQLVVVPLVIALLLSALLSPLVGILLRAKLPRSFAVTHCHDRGHRRGRRRAHAGDQPVRGRCTGAVRQGDRGRRADPGQSPERAAGLSDDQSGRP